jgi:hypothetical protein
MARILEFPRQLMDMLMANPDQTIYDKMHGSVYKAYIGISHYKDKVLKYYSELLNGTDLQTLCAEIEIPFDFNHFGLVLEFERPTELILHDTDMTLNDDARYIVRQVGPFIIKNGYLEAVVRDYGHRNRFPHLSFHFDRNPEQPTVYSMYTRNPFDAEQANPRRASTLFIANIISYLQSRMENKTNQHLKKGVQPVYNIFTDEKMNDVLGKIVLEHAWNGPFGTGEISMIDNRTVLHASYYENPTQKAYRIGVRYVK